MERRNLPIGIQDFQKLRTSGCLYADKTAWVYKLASTESPYFLGRPRRFGKSLLISTLAYYFEGRKDLFGEMDGRPPLAMYSLEKDWIQYPVFHIDLTFSNYRNMADLEAGLDYNLRRLEEKWGTTPGSPNLPTRFSGLIEQAAQKTGLKVVVLIDEYDRPLVQTLENESGKVQEEIRAALKGFYGVLKGSDSHLRFVLLTGVTKFSKVTIFSDLNQLQDISQNEAYAGICGITESELTHYFKPEIEALVDRRNMTFDDALSELRKRYDGYCFAPESERVYNPFSVLNTLSSRAFNYYWFQTGTPTFLIEQLKYGNFSVPDLSGNIVIPPRNIDDYRAVGDNPVPLLYQSGYLTIKSVNQYGEYILGFPNEEVKFGFLEELLRFYTPKKPFMKGLAASNFARDLDTGDIDSFMERVASLIEDIPYDTKKETEHYFQTIVYLVFTLAGQWVQAEVHSHHGRCDAVAAAESGVYLFEFKLSGLESGDKTDEALAQIGAKDYLGPWRSSGKKLVKVGAEYDVAEKKLVAWKAAPESGALR